MRPLCQHDAVSHKTLLSWHKHSARRTSISIKKLHRRAHRVSLSPIEAINGVFREPFANATIYSVVRASARSERERTQRTHIEHSCNIRQHSATNAFSTCVHCARRIWTGRHADRISAGAKRTSLPNAARDPLVARRDSRCTCHLRDTLGRASLEAGSQQRAINRERGGSR